MKDLNLSDLDWRDSHSIDEEPPEQTDDEPEEDEQNACPAFWSYVPYKGRVTHRCELRNGHAGPHEARCGLVSWSREAKELVPEEHEQ